HRTIKLIAPDVVIRLRAVIEDRFVMIPVGMDNVDISCPRIRLNQIASEQAGKADLIIAVSRLLLSAHPERSRPSRIAQNAVGTLLEAAEAGKRAISP